MKVSTTKLRNLSTAMDWQVHTLDTLTHNSFFLTYRTDTTRLEFAIPLRESFALPFIAAQILFTTIYLRQFKFIGKQTQVIQLCLFGVNHLSRESVVHMWHPFPYRQSL